MCLPLHWTRGFYFMLLFGLALFTKLCNHAGRNTCEKPASRRGAGEETWNWGGQWMCAVWGFEPVAALGRCVMGFSQQLSLKECCTLQSKSTSGGMTWRSCSIHVNPKLPLHLELQSLFYFLNSMCKSKPDRHICVCTWPGEGRQQNLVWSFLPWISSLCFVTKSVVTKVLRKVCRYSIDRGAEIYCHI